LGESLSEEGYSVDVFGKGAVIDEDFPFDGGVCTGSAQDAIYFMLPDGVNQPSQKTVLCFSGHVRFPTGDLAKVTLAFGEWSAELHDDSVLYWIEDSQENIAKVLAWRFKTPGFEIFGIDDEEQAKIREYFGLPSLSGNNKVLAFDKTTRTTLWYAADTWRFKTGLVNTDGTIENEFRFDCFEEAFQDFEGRTKEELVQFDDELKLAQSLLDGAFLKCPSTPIVLRYSNGAFEDDDGHIHRLIDFVNVPLIEQSSESENRLGQSNNDDMEDLKKDCRAFIENELQGDFVEFHNEPITDKWYFFNRTALNVYWPHNELSSELTVAIYPVADDGNTLTDELMDTFGVPIAPYL
jgi:hypothetical protein